jgi:hypothetical protein
MVASINYIPKLMYNSVVVGIERSHPPKKDGSAAPSNIDTLLSNLLARPPALFPSALHDRPFQ